MTDKPMVLDSAIHRALREMAQAVADEHGIYITDVNISWYSTGRMIDATKPTYDLGTIDVKTRSL